MLTFLRLLLELLFLTLRHFEHYLFLDFTEHLSSKALKVNFCKCEQSAFIRMFGLEKEKNTILISCLCMSQQKSHWIPFSPLLFSGLRSFILYRSLTERDQTLNHQWGGWTVQVQQREDLWEGGGKRREIVKKCCRWLWKASVRPLGQHKWVTYFFQVNVLNKGLQLCLSSRSCLITEDVAPSMKCLFCN